MNAVKWLATPAPEPRIEPYDGRGRGYEDRLFDTFEEARDWLVEWWTRAAAADKRRWEWSIETVEKARKLKEETT